MSLNISSIEFKLFEQLNIAVAINNSKDGSFVYINKAFIKLIGFTKEEILRLTYKEITPNEYRDKDLEQIKLFQKQGYLGPYDKEFIKKDSSRINVRIHSKLILIDNQEYIWSSFEDYSDPAEKIRESLQFQQIIQDNAAYAIITSNTEGVITNFNKAAEKMLQYKAVDLVNKETPAIFHDLDEVVDRSKQFSKILGKEIEPGFNTFVCLTDAGLPNENEWTYVRKDGSRFVVLLSITKLINSKGEITGYLGIANDITERKKREHELNTAKQEAENALKIKSEFLANMSHEIRTPMNGILGMTALLSEKITDPTKKDMIQTIEYSANSLLQIINDILDFSKYEHGFIDFESQQLNLGKLIGELKKLHSTTLKDKKITLTTKCSLEENLYLLGDEVRISQIINNLLSNAIKFTEAGQIDLNLSSKRINENRVELLITVKDTGIGIDEKDQERIFNSFSQADSSTTRRFGGTGLGLSITKKLVELMGGEIKLESIVNIGTKFDIKIPLAYDLKEELIDSTPITINYENFPLKILVVEDVYINQKIIRKLLEKLNYKPKIVNHGKEALEALKIEHFDIIFMDCHMPILDGFETTKEIIKEYQENKPIIIALTASAMKEDLEKCFDSGMDYFISKPVSLKDITDKLNEIKMKK